MRDSDTFQAILDEGRAEGRTEGRAEGCAEGIQHVLLIVGRKRWGEPDAATRAALESIMDLDRLDRLSEHLLKATSWKELLQIP